MCFSDKEETAFRAKLKECRFELKRAEKLRSRFRNIVIDYLANARGGGSFEAKGLLVTGASRSGKSRELADLFELANTGKLVDVDGQPTKIVSVPLNGTVTMKGMASYMLREGFEYDYKANLTEGEIWDRIFEQSKKRGIIGLHFDECQHAFPKRADMRMQVLNSFKFYMKRSRHPLIMIMSGVSELADFIKADPQLSHLLTSVHFTPINPSKESDLEIINAICIEYAELAEIEFPEKLWNEDFYRRLALSGANQWGLTIMNVIDAIIAAKQACSEELLPEHFCRVFTDKYDLEEGYSPFTIEDYTRFFNVNTIHQLLAENAQP